MDDKRTESAPDPIWLITANVVEDREYKGVERRRGTKHFKGNAKVYIIDAHWGTRESIVVVGHHRTSRRFVQITLAKRHVTNLRMTPCYSPIVLEMVSTEYINREMPDKAEWERQMAAINS